ncbi:MAG: hypothetical protein ABFD89_00760 [Bryobacteraceae bacterium]
MKRKLAGAIAIVLCLAMPVTATGQTTTPQNFVAGGISYNPGDATPIAGTGLYARAVTDSAGTYAFTIIDAIPTSYSPFTVVTNIGAGIAQKVVTIGKVPIFMPTAAGISINGDNTGWYWSSGALASIHLKGSWYLMPNLRFAKSSVNDSSGYQVIAGLLVAFGK